MDVFDLYAKLSLDNSDYDRSLQQSSGSFEQFATKFAMVAKGVAGTLTNVVGKAVDQFASYEQLKGGVETLFGDYAGKVMDNAKRAFETAGMSANEYMETVTSFSASLLQGLGGDTEKAADYADRALQDMSDNANKMGTNIASIQTAYQGFAKQNYTMLDNLKLGYGGTKEEMARLINDASKLTAVQKKLGVTVDASSMSFDNIIAAISVMQESMGIAGTTSEEAATTIEGSKKMMEASWNNMLTSMVTGGKFFDQSMDALVSSVLTYARNLLPAIEGALHGVSSLVSGLSGELGKELPGFLEEVLPDMISAVKSLLSGILMALPGLLTVLKDVSPKVTDALVDLIPDIEKFVLDGIPILADAGLKLLTSLADGLGGDIETSVPQLTSAASAFISAFVDEVGKDTTDFTNTAISILNKLINGISGNLPQVMTDISTAVLAIVNAIIDTITGFDYQTLMDSAVTLVKAVSDGVVAAAGTIAEGLPEIINKIGEWLKTEGNLSGLVDGAAEIISTLAGGLIISVNLITEKLPGIILEILSWFNTEGNLSSLAGGATKILSTLASGITSTISTLTEKLPELITGIFNWLTDTTHLTEMLSAGTTIFNELVKDVPTIIASLVGGIGSIIAGIVNELTSTENLKKVADSALTIFGEIVKDIPAILLGLTVGITSLVSGIVGKIKDLFQNDENSGEMEGGLSEALSGAFNKFKGNIGTWWESDGKATFEEIGKKWKEFFQQWEWDDTFLNFVKKIGTNISAKWDEIKNIFTGEGEGSLSGKIKSWMDSFDVKSMAKTVIDNFKSVGEDMISGLVKGIKDKWEELKSDVEAIFSTPVNWLKDKLGIKSPSKVFFEIGKFIDEGYANGISAYSGLIENAMKDIAEIPEVNANMDIAPVKASSGSGASVASGGDFAGWTINVYGSEGMDEQTLARAVADRVRDEVVSIGAVI